LLITNNQRTAGRSGEVRFAKWSEIDIDAKVWTVPAVRMKAAQVHRVPLCDRAVAIIEERAAYRCNDFIFPVWRAIRQLAKM
jgi:integrase